MKLTKIIRLIVAFITVTFASLGSVVAQEGDGNVFSPYSLYGIGVLDGQGSAAIQSMSGTSVATKTPFTINTSNPASYSVAPTQTMLFSMGMIGNNDYLKSNTGKSSSNNFTLGDLSAQFPITRNMGAAFSYSSYSSVGYSISMVDNQNDDLVDIGHVGYDYVGYGGFGVIKAGLGWQPIKGFSIGANILYYMGSTNRSTYTTFYPVVSQDKTYRTTTSFVEDRINKVGGEVGFQYDVDLKHDRFLTIGGVYTPKLNAGLEKYLYQYTSNDKLTDSVYLKNSNEKLILPTKISVGLAYRSSKLTLAADYIHQNWENSMNLNEIDNVQLTSLESFSVGAEFTPNRNDLRSHLKRWTYRAGAKTSTSYMMFNNNKIRQYSASVGLGIPLQRGGGSQLNVGIEAGKRGGVSSGIVNETFMKINIGFSLFTAQEWFVRHKFK